MTRSSTARASPLRSISNRALNRGLLILNPQGRNQKGEIVLGITSQILVRAAAALLNPGERLRFEAGVASGPGDGPVRRSPKLGRKRRDRKAPDRIAGGFESAPLPPRPPVGAGFSAAPRRCCRRRRWRYGRWWRVPWQAPRRPGPRLGRHLALEQIAAHGSAASLTPRALDRSAIMSPVNNPVRMRIGIDPVGADTILAIVERILAHERERRGLGQAVGPKLVPGLTACLETLNSRTAAGRLLLHDGHGFLRYAPDGAKKLSSKLWRKTSSCDLADPPPARRRRRSRPRCRRRRTFPRSGRRPRATELRSHTLQATAKPLPPRWRRPRRPPQHRSSTATAAPSAANASPSPRRCRWRRPSQPPPGRCSALATTPLSLACFEAPVLTSNSSASGSGSKRPMASASVMTRMAFSARSAAMAASFAVAPTPNKPKSRY